MPVGLDEQFLHQKCVDDTLNFKNRLFAHEPVGGLCLQIHLQNTLIFAAAQNVADHVDAEPLPGARHAGEHLLCFHGGLYQNGAARAAGAIAAVFLGGLAEVF